MTVWSFSCGEESELQKKPVFRIIQINLCELLDALQTVGQGTSMYIKLTGCLKRIAFMLQIDLGVCDTAQYCFFGLILQHPAVKRPEAGTGSEG